MMNEFEIPPYMRFPAHTAFRTAVMTDTAAGCPTCSCGAVEDWENVAPLRCTGCKQSLAWPQNFLRLAAVS